MRRFMTLAGAFGLGAASIAACSGDDLIVGPMSGSGFGGTGGGAFAGRGGRGGGAGSGGAAGRGAAGSDGSSAGDGGSGAFAGSGGIGAEADAGVDAGELDAGLARGDAGDAGDAGPVVTCDGTPDCDDENACTSEVCAGQVCLFTPVAIGTPCGDTTTTNECNQADSCDGSGVCLTNQAPEGTLCEDGRCNTGGACDCAIDRATTLPYNQQWQTTADTETNLYEDCQICGNTLDHVVVFTAPQTASYRFFVTGGDPELAVFEGDCAGALANATCGADIDPDNEDYADVLDLEIEAGATVTVVIGESCEEFGGAGTLSIDISP